MINWESCYLPPDTIVWQGRDDMPAGSCFYQLIRPLNLLTELPQQDGLPLRRNLSLGEIYTSPELNSGLGAGVMDQQRLIDKTAATTFALVGFKCDEGVRRDLGRTGAFEAPIAIRRQLAMLPIQNQHIHCYDIGNIICTDHDLEKSQAALAYVITLLIKQNITPIVIGGGHEISWGNYQGIANAISKQEPLGILNFDPHFDLQPTHTNHRGSATTTFYQIAEDHKKQHKIFDYNCIGIQHAANIRHQLETAKKFKTKTIFADDIHQGLQEKCFDFVDRIIDENHYIYLSLSLDVFSPAFAPGVNAIQPLGLNPWHVIPLLRQIAASGKAISYDIAEHVPRYDIDHRTAKLAAILIYEIIHAHNLNITQSS